MASSNKFVDDVSRVMSGAAGVAQGAINEAENAMKGWTQKWVSQQGFVSREEFDVVAEMAKKARAENEMLKEELDGLKAELANLSKTKSTKGTKKS